MSLKLDFRLIFNLAVSCHKKRINDAIWPSTQNVNIGWWFGQRIKNDQLLSYCISCVCSQQCACQGLLFKGHFSGCSKHVNGRIQSANRDNIVIFFLVILVSLGLVAFSNVIFQWTHLESIWYKNVGYNSFNLLVEYDSPNGWLLWGVNKIDKRVQSINWLGSDENI